MLHGAFPKKYALFLSELFAQEAYHSRMSFGLR